MPTITQDDIRFYASERMTDAPDGGGRMSTTVIVDGQDNNVFDDITDIERLAGETSLRKVSGAVVNVGTDAYLSAHAIIDVPPTDTATACALLAMTGYTSERLAAVNSLYSADLDLQIGGSPTIVNGVIEEGTPYFWYGSTGDTPVSVQPAKMPAFFAGGVFDAPPACLRWIRLAENATYPPAGAPRNRYVAEKNFPGTVGNFTAGRARIYTTFATPAARCYGVTSVLGAVSVGSTVDVSEVFAAVAPISEQTIWTSALEAAWNLSHSVGVDSQNLSLQHGRRQIIKQNDVIVIHDTQNLAPATYSNGSTANAGRTGLSRFRVVDANGAEVVRFTRGIASTFTAITANLDTGILTFVNVAGFVQPLTVEHRIEEMALAASLTPIAGGVRIGLNRTLSRAYPSTARVSSAYMLGDLQGRVQRGFAQTSWTGVWSDAVQGGQPSADFNQVVYPITTTNKGAVTERWYALLTNTNTFKVFGEYLGEIGTGNTSSVFAPINPATGEPYFSIPPAGWGTGWSAGNVFRWNTVGANAPVWLLRSVLPSTPSGDDSVTPELRGYINA